MENRHVYPSLEQTKNLTIGDGLIREEKTFQKGDTILHAADSSDMLAYLVSGKAYLIRIDIDGRRSILEYFEPGNIFGKALAPDSRLDSYFVQAAKKCSVTYLNTQKLFQPCENQCECPIPLLENLFQTSFQKSQRHLDILSKRTTRGKLLTYFEYLRSEKENFRFTLPLSLSDLADYLCVDRSAMMREIKKLNDDGIIRSHGSTVILQKNEYGI